LEETLLLKTDTRVGVELSLRALSQRNEWLGERGKVRGVPEARSNTQQQEDNLFKFFLNYLAYLVEEVHRRFVLVIQRKFSFGSLEIL
jgi:hypothetical protein